MDNPDIILLTHGQFEMDFIAGIADDVHKEFQCPVDVREGRIWDLMIYYDHARRQYDGNKLLKDIDSMLINSTSKKIGLFMVDLFIPILTYIFGQSIYKGNSGIASIYRLRNEQYGMKPNKELAYNRFKKVIIHEIGHSFGLIHCHVPYCVMRSSTYVEDIDQKKQHLCPHCQNTLFG